MAERRVTQVSVHAEYATPTNLREVTQVLVHAEYATPTNFRQVTQVAVMVEYWADWPVPKRVGPPVQLI